MKRNQLKFVVGSLAIVLTLGYLGFSGFEGNNFYSQSVAQLHASGDERYERRLSVTGEVVAGSIQREGKVVKFVIHEKEDATKLLPVEYRGTDPLPDMFRDYADATVEGRFHRDGTFVATKMATKCASKYERETAAGLITSENMKAN